MSSLSPRTAGLAPYRGPFNRSDAWHLLRRVTFAPTPARVGKARRLGLDRTLDRLLAGRTSVPEPINADFPDDPAVPIGQTWVRAPVPRGTRVELYRSLSLRAWLVETAYAGGFDLSARMSLFWHNHFAVPDLVEARAYYAYRRRLRDDALGNFRDLVRAVTTEPAMLAFLNGDVNTAEDPNENFAREPPELYTLGKGPLAGEGDYTTYTEGDVRAIARALTGWRNRHLGAADPAKQPESWFDARRHDAAPRQLSSRFGGRTLTAQRKRAVDEVIDAVFAHPAAPFHVCRKLYRFFVYHEIDDVVEAEVITPLAELLRASDYEVAPVLRRLFASAHFFAAAQRGALVKSPLDYALDLTAGLGFPVPADDPLLREGFFRQLYATAKAQSMTLDAPPTVAGYRPWHQAPSYHRGWINAANLAERAEFAERALGNGFRLGDVRLRNRLLDVVDGFDNPYDPNDLVDEFAARLLTDPLTDAQRASLKEVLLPGLPDFEWTVEYTAYRDRPRDQRRRKAVERKVRALAYALATTPEAHLY